jgi:para-aminobenzoate synthetase/4-amino-4-deoxychorismate lyase
VGRRTLLQSRLSVEDAASWLRGDPRPFALAGDWLGGLTLLGSQPVAVAAANEDPFLVLDRRWELDLADAKVGGGWVGWLGYGLGRRLEPVSPSAPAPVPRATFSLAFYDHLVVFDGEQWWFEALWTRARDAFLDERLTTWKKRLPAKPRPAQTPSPPAFRLTGNGAAGNLAAVADCRERIVAGELFQANLCVRLEGPFNGDPVDLFARALPMAQPRFGALVDGAVSLSPERFLRRTGREVRTEPIKGTRQRAGTPQERSAAREALLASDKDAAEHVMIVDLMRNDLGRVCAYGSIAADAPHVEAHGGVWHLVSSVSGRLRDDVGDGELLRATFPPGSVTGAPKVQAMKVIAALESTRRELYTGAIGIASPIAGLDLSVAIRTFEIRNHRIWFGAGGGIVADSDPVLELQEAIAKATGPCAAIGGQLARPSRRRPPDLTSWEPALTHGSRPEPDCGVFETVLVENHQPGHLREHLVRLRASLTEPYGAGLDPATAATARELANQFRNARATADQCRPRWIRDSAHLGGRHATPAARFATAVRARRRFGRPQVARPPAATRPRRSRAGRRPAPDRHGWRSARGGPREHLDRRAGRSCHTHRRRTNPPGRHPSGPARHR